MRLHKFTNPKTYTSTDNDTTDCLSKIEKLWPHSIGDDGAPSPSHVKKSRAKATTLVDAPSMCRHINRE
jgi:hypothetical protein